MSAFAQTASETNPSLRIEGLRASVGADNSVRVFFKQPVLDSDERILSSKLLRSTTDLELLRRTRRFPVAEFTVGPHRDFYVDEVAPQDVNLYYQLQVKTSKRKTYRSNVAKLQLVSPRVPQLIEPSLLVDKAAYSLYLLDSGRIVRRFPIALGANSKSRKLHQDRASTPEGVYRISGLQPTATYHRAIDIDYPNARDKARYNFFQSQGLLPYPAPEIGGEIQIHGEGITSNWTWGCVAMRNEDMDWLFDRPELQKGLEVQIVGSELRPQDLSLEKSLTENDYEQLRTSLEKLGYRVDMVGSENWYGAISKFQKDRGLPITGILDQLTRARILESAKEYGLLPRQDFPTRDYRGNCTSPKQS